MITIEDADAALGALGLDDILPEVPVLAEPVVPQPAPRAGARAGGPPVVVVPALGEPLPRGTGSTRPPPSLSQSSSTMRKVVTIPPLEDAAKPPPAATPSAATPPRAHARPPSEGLDLDLFLGDPDLLELGPPGAAAPAEPVQAVPAAIGGPVGGELSSRYPSIEAAIEAFAQKDKDPDPSTIEFDDSRIDARKRPTSELPAITEQDLERAATKPPPEMAAIEDTPADAGDFAQVPPLKLLYRLLSQRQTGLLVTTVGAIKKEIFVRDGIPEYVSSNLSSELLGNWLVSQGVLSAGELAMALAMMPHYGGKLGDTVVGLGLLKPLEVFRHLTRQVRAKLIDVCTWTKGRYAWYSDRENPREAFPLDLNAFEVLGAGAMALGDDAVEAWLERNQQLHLKATRAAKFGPDRFELPGLRAVWDGLDGRSAIERVIARYTAEADRKRTTRMLMLLEYCELARRVEVSGR